MVLKIPLTTMTALGLLEEITNGGPRGFLAQDDNGVSISQMETEFILDRI